MKTAEELYHEMCAEFQRRTGTELAGTGELAVRLYAVAAQIHALYMQSEWTARQCFPQSAQGTYLEQHAALRGLERRAAARAEGVIRFLTDMPAEGELAIPAGTVCMTADLIRFETVEEAALPAGAREADVRARAAEPGAAGNVAAETVVAMSVAPVGISRCTNPAAFSGGTDREKDEDLRERVLETFRRMPNGANAAFYEQGALSFEEVAAAAVLPRSRGVGTVDIVVSTRQGVPEEGLLKALTDYFEARREIAVDVAVKAPAVREISVRARVVPAEGRREEEALAAAREAVESWFDGTRLGKSVLRAELSGRIFAREEVGNCVVLEPAEDVTLRADELPRLKSVTVEGTA